MSVSQRWLEKYGGVVLVGPERMFRGKKHMEVEKVF